MSRIIHFEIPASDPERAASFLLPGMLLGAIVGFATQRFGRKTESQFVNS